MLTTSDLPFSRTLPRTPPDRLRRLQIARQEMTPDIRCLLIAKFADVKALGRAGFETYDTHDIGSAGIVDLHYEFAGLFGRVRYRDDRRVISVESYGVAACRSARRAGVA